MRLWHYKLIPVLPTKMLIAQWRECIAIMRQWQKGTLKHKLVSYVKEHKKDYFYKYVHLVTVEMKQRGIKFNDKYLNEISIFTGGCGLPQLCEGYPEHNDRYLNQCYYNLQEKYDRGIIAEKEWQKIRFYHLYKVLTKDVKFCEDASCEYCGGRLYNLPIGYICEDCGEESECK